jgi:sodium transport system permease protein
MIQFKALLIKELKEAFRDRRALMVAMSMAVMAPVMIFAMSKFAINEAVDTPPIYAQITGSEFAPKLMKQFKDDNILLFTEVPADEKSLWQERNIQITIPESFADDMIDGKTIDVVLRTDYSDKAMRTPIRRIKNSVADYARYIGYKRLLVRGIDIKLLQPVNLVEQDTASPSSNAMFISMMLGFYLLMAAFMSGLSVAIDSSAGERERNVLEILLCQPVSTLKIVLAKLCCATFSVGFVDLTKIGATFNLGAGTIATLLFMLIPICFFASALQLFFSFQAKSFKEAQSTVTMIIMLPSMIPFILMFIDDKPQWLDWMPISGQSLLMEDIFKGIPVSWSALLLTATVTIALTVILVQALAVKLKSEKVVLALS